MSEIVLRDIRADEYYALYKRMKLDFPLGELAPFFVIKRNLDKRVFAGYIMAGAEGDIGYAIVTAPEGMAYALINYFAIYPEYRSQGCGSEFIRILLERYSDRTILLESEDPAAKKSQPQCDVAARRIKFYERLGFNILPTEKAAIFGVDMLIMANMRDEKGRISTQDEKGRISASGEKERISARDTMHALYLPSLGSKQWLRFIDVRDAKN